MRAVLDLLAPVTCAACGTASDGELCAGCAERVVVCARPMCERCGHPGPSGSCACRRLDGFDRARSLVAFVEPARSLVLAIKRRGTVRTLTATGALLASLAESEWGKDAFDAVTFVPAGRSAAAKGFDHARALARSVATDLGVEVLPLVRRVASGPRQADVSFDERWSNVANRFEAAAGACEAIGAAGRVLLVDDVLTTGATAAACGGALKRAGAASVDVLTFARTVRRGDGSR